MSPALDQEDRLPGRGDLALLWHLLGIVLRIIAVFVFASWAVSRVRDHL